MELRSDKFSRGERVQLIQRDAGCDEDNVTFAQRLNEAARSLGLPANWSSNRLAKVRTGSQNLSIEDMTVISKADPKGRGWTFVAWGLATEEGEDPMEVLARNARRRTASR